MTLRAQKLQRVIDATAAGTSDVIGAAVDTKGFDTVTFIVAFGAITATAVTSVKAQQGAASDLSDAADLAGTSIAVAADDDDQIVGLEINQPRERYVRVVVDRGTANAVIDSGVAILSKATKEPVTQDAATVVGVESHVAPAEGTA